MVPPSDSSRRLLGGECELRVLPKYLRVWHGRSASNLEELMEVLDAIDQALETHGVSRVMFDSRDADYSEGEVQSRMWAWLTGHPVLDRVATLVQSPRLAVSVGLTGMSKGVKIKAFHIESEAATWLGS